MVSKSGLPLRKKSEGACPSAIKVPVICNNNNTNTQRSARLQINPQPSTTSQTPSTRIKGSNGKNGYVCRTNVATGLLPNSLSTPNQRKTMPSPTRSTGMLQWRSPVRIRFSNLYLPNSEGVWLTSCSKERRGTPKIAPPSLG